MIHKKKSSPNRRYLTNFIVLSGTNSNNFSVIGRGDKQILFELNIEKNFRSLH